MPDLSHLWHRFMMATALVFGLAVGVLATVFGYSNLSTVDVHWSVFHLDGVPLWTVAVVPLAVVLVAGTIYHWANSFHHFTEHMRHRHRVRELETEVTRLKSHLDHVLEMPDHSATRGTATVPPIAPEPAPIGAPALPEAEAAASNGGPKSTRRALARKKTSVETATESEAVAALPAAEEATALEPEVVQEPEKAADPVEA